MNDLIASTCIRIATGELCLGKNGKDRVLLDYAVCAISFRAELARREKWVTDPLGQTDFANPTFRFARDSGPQHGQLGMSQMRGVLRALRMVTVNLSGWSAGSKKCDQLARFAILISYEMKCCR